MVQAAQVRRVVYVAQVGSVVRSHLHDWGAVPPVTLAVRLRAVPAGWGEAGLAVRLVKVGGTEVHTETVNVFVLMLPAASLAVTVTVVTPSGKVLPEGGLALTVGAGSRLSVTLGSR